MIQDFINWIREILQRFLQIDFGFRVGDICFLRGGSIDLHVESILGNKITCTWVGGNRHTFLAHELTHDTACYVPMPNQKPVLKLIPGGRYERVH